MIRCLAALCLLSCAALAQEDATLALARRAAAEYGASLPDYVCQQNMERYDLIPNALRSQPRLLDRVTAEVVYEHGDESFRNLRINGKPAEKAENGLWTKGLFGPLMASLFEPRIAAQFRLRGKGKEAGREVTRYDFSVAEANSNWAVSAFEGQAKPPYKGTIWVETATGRILRHELVTEKMPATFPYQAAMLSIRYRFVKISGTEYLLPQTTESRLCPRNYLYCSRVESTYTGCHKFSIESSVKFEEEK